MKEGFPAINKLTKSDDSETTALIAPQFIREFSRENSTEERSQLSSEIRKKRQERDAFRVEQNELTAEQEKIVSELNELRDKIEEYDSAGFLHKITDYLEYRNLQAAVAKQLEAQGEVEQAMQELEETPAMFEEPKKMLIEFYQGERQKWAEAGYDPEDIKKYFSEENLSRLSVEEYALLMQRFPGEMVTHVTRQGIRDHASTSFHTAGIGEFHNGFKSVIEDRCIRSSLGIALQEKTKEAVVAKYMHLDQVDNINLDRPNESKRSKALSLYQKNFLFRRTDDVSAVHVAAELVMDEMYGGETGNEIFFAYPSAHIAAEHKYSGFIDGSMARDYLGDKSVHNDSKVYLDGYDGMSLDAALVFIPEDAQVDILTGSKYETTERNQSFEKAIQEIISARFDKLGFIQKFGQPLPWQLEGLNDEERRELLDEAYRKFGITEPLAQKIVLDTEYITKVINGTWGTDHEHDAYQKVTLDYLKKDVSTLKPPKNTVTSREYWENYFLQNPEQRPSKIVYYKSGDPSAALNTWRRQNGIIKKTEDRKYGLPENNVSEASPEENISRDRLAALALKIIDDRFPETEDERLAREEEEEMEKM